MIRFMMMFTVGRLGKNARLSGEICASTGSGKKSLSHGKGIVSECSQLTHYFAHNAFDSNNII